MLKKEYAIRLRPGAATLGHSFVAGGMALKESSESALTVMAGWILRIRHRGATDELPAASGTCVVP
jgi:hypothetical protein